MSAWVGGTLTSTLIVRLLDQVTKLSAIRLSSALLGLNRAANAASGTFGVRLGAAIQKNNAALADARGGLVDAVAGFYALKTAIGAPLKAAADFETALEDIGQKADIPQERLGALGERIKQIGRDTNQAATEVGKAVDSLLGRGASEDVALAAAGPISKAAFAYRAATDDLAAASWSAVDNLKVPADQIATAIDMMAQAGKDGAFELKDMAQYFPALGAAYQGLGQEGTSAVADLAAALQIVRKGAGDSASAATNLGNVLQKVYAPQTVKAFKEAGVDLRKEMAKAAKDGQTPIEAIANITNKALGGDLSKLGDLFQDAQVQQGMRALIQNMEEYRKVRADAMKAASALRTRTSSA
ncbi:phage tail tape measure protein [Rhizobium leguminosarum bv. viciae]|uniref:Phage tail tape measure protein n=1 Tax=Rhizobium leguminosarum bv. viciae TaxID=387 RepID=A0A7G6RKV1_RHILV|nr:phage tail tape measure protein [Rhizobium leguminosarum bv. viciae]